MQVIQAKDIHLEAMAKLELDNFSQPWTLSSLKEAILRQDTIYLVALDQNQVIGYLGVWQSLDEGELVSIVVQEAYRHQNIGKFLIEKLMEIASLRKLHYLFLEVRVSNVRAIHFYQKCGFQTIGIRKNFYDRPKEDAKMMRLNMTYL